MSYAPGSESAHMFHLSHFHRLVRFCWFGLVVGGVCWVSLLFLLTTDQPVRSSYQPMTIIIYLLDCHCRYDERSIVQKKNSSPDNPSKILRVTNTSADRQMPLFSTPNLTDLRAPCGRQGTLGPPFPEGILCRATAWAVGAGSVAP